MFEPQKLPTEEEIILKSSHITCLATKYRYLIAKVIVYTSGHHGNVPLCICSLLDSK
jgi:hypothetical protein